VNYILAFYKKYCSTILYAVTFADVNLTHTGYTIQVGQSEKIYMYFQPHGYEYASDLRDIRYASGDPSIATVDQNGWITAVAPGVVTIHIGGQYTAKESGQDEQTFPLYKTLQITVLSPASIADIDIIQSESVIPSVVFPEGYTGPETGTWSIDDPCIASIGMDGRITRLKPGTTRAF